MTFVSLCFSSRSLPKDVVNLKQFQGVVVIDDILHHKSRLQLATASKSEKVESLNELCKKIPPRHVMISTKIGEL